MQDLWTTTVRFAETDAQGIVFYGEYVTYQDETFSQYLREIDYPWTDIEQEAWDIHVVNVDIDYRASAAFGDELVCDIRVAAIEESSLTLEWTCRRRDGPVCAEGTVTHAAVADGETTRVPDAFREAVVAAQAEPPEPV